MSLPVKLLASGAYLPERRLLAADIDRRFGKPAGWSEQYYGIASRHVAGPAETTSMMAAAAARQALVAAGMAATDLDCIVAACGVSEQAIPGTAPLVQDRLGLGASGIPAFDVNATCLSFVAALDLIGLAIAAGRYKRVLIVSSDIASAGLDWNTPEAAAIFGDGAAAAIIGRAGDGDGACILSSGFETYGEGKNACVLAAGGTRLRPRDDYAAFLAGTYFRMDGRAAYKLAKQRLPAFWARLLAGAGVRGEQIATVIPHQASASGLALIPRPLGLPAEKFFKVFARVGNMIASSIPFALHTAITSGHVRRGDTIALLGTSAGMSLGGMVLRY